MDRIPSNTKIDKSHCKVEESQGVVSTEMHHVAAKKFSDLPYDIKFIIWGLVIRQPRIVQVKAQMEETSQKPEETEPPNHRIKLSIESCTSIYGFMMVFRDHEVSLMPSRF
jgi:hypothetical protein